MSINLIFSFSYRFSFENIERIALNSTEIIERFISFLHECFVERNNEMGTDNSFILSTQTIVEETTIRSIKKFPFPTSISKSKDEKKVKREGCNVDIFVIKKIYRYKRWVHALSHVHHRDFSACSTLFFHWKV